MLSQKFVFHKSKNFTSDNEIRMPPTVPLNHYSGLENQQNKTRVLYCYSMLMYSERWLALNTLIFFKVTTPTPRPRQSSPGARPRQKGSGNQCTPKRRTGRPNPKSNYELFNCNNLNIRYWSWNYRGCWHQTCPPMDPR